MSGLQYPVVEPPRECGGMAECLVSESARVRDGAAAGLPGAKVFPVQHPTHARPHARDRAAPQTPPSPKSFAILDAG